MNHSLLSTAYRDNVVRVDASEERKLVEAYWFNRFRAVGNRYPRKGPNPAAEAIVSARQDVASGRKRYASSPWRKPAGNGARVDGKQWVENPAAMGLRFVGYVDEIVSGIRHTGWYSDAFQDSKIRGCVYQLPGRGGKARFVAAHDNEENGAANAGGPAYVDFSTVYTSDFCAEMRSALASIGKAYQTPAMLQPGYWAEAAHESAKKETARAADRFAEEELEYQTAWQAGSQWADLGNEIESSRDTIKALLAERRAAKAARLLTYPTICATIRKVVSNALGDIADARNRRQRLASGDADSLLFWPGDSRLKEAFNDGAGRPVLR